MPWTGYLFDRDRYLHNTGLEFKRARLARGLSREALADAARLHPNTIAGFERGDRDVSSATHCWILAALGCHTVILEDNTERILLDEGSKYFARTDIQHMSYAEIISMMGSLLRELRSHSGLSLNELSSATSIHGNTIWNIERGLVCPMSSHIYRLYRELGLVSITPSPTGISYALSQSLV